MALNILNAGDVLKTAQRMLRKADEPEERKPEEKDEPSYLLDDEGKELAPEPPGPEEGPKGHEEPDEDNYRPEEMKRYMKRFMAENPEYVKEEMRRSGLLAKAVDIAHRAVRADADKYGADAVMVEGTALFKALVDQNRSIMKQLEGIHSYLGHMSGQNVKSLTLSKANALMGQASLAISEAMSKQPIETKGLLAGGAAPVQPGQFKHSLPLIKAQLRTDVKEHNVYAASSARLLNMLTSVNDQNVLSDEAVKALRSVDARIA